MCGIAAIVGQYDKTAAKLLSIAQDSRGRDNAGIAYFNGEGALQLHKGGIENRRATFNNYPELHGEEGLIATSLTEMLCQRIELPLYTLENSVFMAHSRKGSVGGTSTKFAHPIKVKNIILCHNGTITNYDKLSKELGLTGVGFDSKAIAKAVHSGCHKDFFEQYEGSCTVIWMNVTEPNKLYAFVGTDKYYHQVPRAGRPLHFLQRNGTVYISSEARPLDVLGALYTEPGDELPKVEHFPTNCIVSITGGEVEILEMVNRKIERQPVNLIPKGTEQGTSGDKYADVRKGVRILNKEAPNFEDDKLSVYHGQYYIGDVIANNEPDFSGSTIRFIPIYVSPNTGYCMYKHADKDTFNLWNTGTEWMGDRSKLVKLYFYDGILMRSKAAYLELLKNDTKQVLPSTIAKYSAMPVFVGMYYRLNITSSFFVSHTKSRVLEGNYYFPFTDKKYEFKVGQLQAIDRVTKSLRRSATNKFLEKYEEWNKESKPKAGATQKFEAIIRSLNRTVDANPDSEEAKAAATAAEVLSKQLNSANEKPAK